jgi:hypothetical protein
MSLTVTRPPDVDRSLGLASLVGAGGDADA